METPLKQNNVHYMIFITTAEWIFSEGKFHAIEEDLDKIVFCCFDM